MDSVNRIFNLVNEAKKGKGKAMIPSHKEKKGGKKSKLGDASPYDHDYKMKRVKEEKDPKVKKPKPKFKPTDAERAALVAKHGEKIGNAMATQRGVPKKGMQTESSEIISILDIIKEAYQDELISEEAFLAIADPIMKSLAKNK